MSNIEELKYDFHTEQDKLEYHCEKCNKELDVEKDLWWDINADPEPDYILGYECSMCGFKQIFKI